MRRLTKYEMFNEAKDYSNKNLVSEICIAMVLLNNEFLDSILDSGLKARYTENSQRFLTDLKNLLLAKNRLNLGKFIDNVAITDEEISKINILFETIKFDIEKDWKKLVDARIVARSIRDKLLPGRKVEAELIKSIYWVGPNKSEEYQEDMVIELNDGKQYSFFLNKNLSTTKTASFNKFADYIIGDDIDHLFSESYLPRWDKLTQEWVKLLYENSNKEIQAHIEKFINPDRIDTLTYFEYFDVKHHDNRFKHLGEFMKEFDRNILKLSDLLSELWKKRENFFMDSERVSKEWYETKVVILNSKILENLLTTSLKKNFYGDIKKMENGFKLSSGNIKMKLFKTIVDKMDCLERDIYFIDGKGNNFYLIPSRDFFRKFYNDLDILFDYHVKFVVNSDEEENNDFIIKLKLMMDDKELISMNISVKFSGGEMSGKLSAKYKYELADNFNYLIGSKQTNV